MARASDKRVLLDLLGVDERTPWEDVRRAFRSAVRNSHPDVHGGDPRAEQRLKTLNAAWDQVNTPGKWAQYVLPSVGSAGAGPAGTAGGGRRGVPADADPTLGLLRVMRQRRGSAGLRQWNLELGGEVIGTIANGQTTLMAAPPGHHSARVFYDHYSSPPLELHVRAGIELTLGCRQQPKALLSVYAPRRSLLLELLDQRRFA